MGLREHREAVVLEPLDEPDLPERLVAVELLGEDPARQVLELALGARRGERGGAHVVAEVEVRVVDPARPALPQRDEGEPLAVARHERQAPLERLEEVGVGGRGPLEQHHAGHVHVAGGVLEVEEGRVEASQTIACHRSV
jgi:hypothetical protein